MTNAVATIPKQEIEIIKSLIAPKCSDDELKMFLLICDKKKLDPLSKQVYAIKRKDATGKETMTIQISIDGLRLLAQRSKDYDGQEGPWWCGKDGVWKDVWTSDEYPMAAKVIVRRRNTSAVFTAVAMWNEYCQKKYNGELTQMWAKFPTLMLAKCAEALALRKAFADDCFGLYTLDEYPETIEVENQAPPAATPKASKSKASQQAMQQLPADISPPKTNEPPASSGTIDIELAVFSRNNPEHMQMLTALCDKIMLPAPWRKEHGNFVLDYLENYKVNAEEKALHRALTDITKIVLSNNYYEKT